MAGRSVLLRHLPSPHLRREPLGTGRDLAANVAGACSAAGERGRVVTSWPIFPLPVVFPLRTAGRHRGKDGREASGECGHDGTSPPSRGLRGALVPLALRPFARRSRLSSRPGPEGRPVPGLCSRSLLWDLAGLLPGHDTLGANQPLEFRSLVTTGGGTCRNDSCHLSGKKIRDQRNVPSPRTEEEVVRPRLALGHWWCPGEPLPPFSCHQVRGVLSDGTLLNRRFPFCSGCVGRVGTERVVLEDFLVNGVND